MGYSLLDAAQSTRQQALQGMADVSNQEAQREADNKQLKAAKKATTMGAVGTGAAVGMMAGAQAGSVGGPWGAAIGAGIGLVASLF